MWAKDHSKFRVQNKSKEKIWERHILYKNPVSTLTEQNSFSTCQFSQQSSAFQTHSHLLLEEADHLKEMGGKCSSIHHIEATHTYCPILRWCVLFCRPGSILPVLHSAKMPWVSGTETALSAHSFISEAQTELLHLSHYPTSCTNVLLRDSCCCILLIFLLCHHLQVLQSHGRELLIKVKSQRALCIWQSVVE